MTKSVGLAFLLLAMIVVHGVLWAQSGATLLATTDLDCKWKLDGKPQGLLKVDDAKVVAVSLGKHLVQATSADGQDEWRTVVNITQAGQEMVEIKLKAAREKRAADTGLQKDPTWTDATTGLMWTRQDNGSEVDWNQANNYCANLRLAGYSNWQLPSIDELAGIYDQTQNVRGNPIKGGITLSGDFRIWSHSTGTMRWPDGDRIAAWSFWFRLGERAGFPLDTGTVRVLCVRRSGK